MALFFLQTGLLLLTACGLWRLWRLFDVEPNVVRWAFAAGFFVRAVGGAILFWVSYLHLNIARSLQLGDGIWFFALDGTSYMRMARETAGRGLMAVFEISPTFTAVVYTRLLGVLSWLLGTSTAIALLLNVLAYTGTVLVLVHWARVRCVPLRYTMLPVLGVSFLPSWILWSVQPLKDVFFCFLVVLFIFGVDRMALAWRREEGLRLLPAMSGAVATLVALYALAGIRWYYATLAFGVALLAYVWIIAYARGVRQIVAVLLVTGTIVLASTEMIIAGAGPYLPDPVLQVFRPFSHASTIKDTLSAPSAMLTGYRQGFDNAREANTQIGAGRLLANDSATPVAPSSASARRTTESVAQVTSAAGTRPPAEGSHTSDVERHRTERGDTVAESVTAPVDQNAVDLSRGMHPSSPSRPARTQSVAKSIAAPAGTHAHGAVPTLDAPAEPAENHDLAAARHSDLQPVSGGSATGTPSTASTKPNKVSGLAARRTLQREPVKTRSEPVAFAATDRDGASPQHEAKPSTATLRETRKTTAKEHRPMRAAEPPVAPVPENVREVDAAPLAVAPDAASHMAEDGATVDGAMKVPATHAARLVSGLAALLLPRSVAVSLGLISVGGGRGLWLFADIDTILFDLLLIMSAVSVVVAFRRGAWRDPLLWFLIIMSVIMSGLLAYTVSNYGTLFRHREMVAATAWLLALGARTKRQEAAATVTTTATDSLSAGDALPRVG